MQGAGDMNKFLCLCALLILCGCSTAFKRNLFVSVRNDAIGSKKENIIHPGYLRIPYSEKLDKYIGADDNGCQWAYYVNKETGIIESWEFISSPDKCQTGLDWLGPW